MRALALVMLLAAAPAAAQEAPAPTAPQVAAPAPTVPAGDEGARNAAVLSAIAGLSPMIGDVQIVGPWVDADRHGTWRTVMTQPVAESTGNRFFVQQMEERDGATNVIASTEINEIATIEGAVVGYRADAPAEGQEKELTLFFDIVPLDGEVSESYELFFTPGEPYRFGPATN